ncbi:hypothetical protein [Leifsonia sp. Leaf264]|uniref:hypothetical protein n=1 Tax=Leifsonia sp. Leaf264 TaxID=1736314 RepID=UPI0006F5C410|nr:hypothetical protein [Leifsonia sp. Leaf264]KQO99688.1 hypothetical protein ASF30_07210 [Leifsonia sp. Leaf264]
MSTEERFFTERRQGLYYALVERNAEIGGLYRSALRELSRAIEAGEQPSHVGLICHSMREFMGGLPGIFSAEVRKRDGDADKLVQDLPTMAAKYPDMDLELDQKEIPVPREIAGQLGRIIISQREIAGRIRANQRLLLTGDAGLHSRDISTWNGLYRFFQGHTHWDRGTRSKPLPTDERLNEKIALVDDLMEPRVRPFLEGRPAVDDLLKRLNGEGAQDA